MKHIRVSEPFAKYILCLLLVTALALCLFCPAAQAEELMGEQVELSTLTGDRTLTDGTYHLTGTTAHSLTIGGTATLWLDDAAILTTGTSPALTITDSANVTIRLIGESRLLSGGEEQAGIRIATGATVTIGTGEDTGTLQITGGAWANGVAGTGTLQIAGGTVYATGGDESSGIGTSVVRITGGTVVANGGYGSAGIGGGNKEVGGVIEITGGTVFATGGDYAPGIGSGARAAGETAVYIRGGSVQSVGGANAKRPIDTVKETATATEPSTLVTLTGWTAGAEASFVRLNTGEYGATQMRADAEGKFYLWLPADAVLRRMQVEEKTYLFALEAGESGSYVYATEDIVLDVSEGQISIQGNRDRYTITGTQVATDEPICLNGATVTFYNLNANSQVQITGETSIQLAGENLLTGNGATPLLLDVQSVCTLTGESLLVHAIGVPAVQASGELRIGTPTQNATVQLSGTASNYVFDSASGALLFENGSLCIEAEQSAVRADSLRVTGGSLTILAAQTGVTATEVCIEGGTTDIRSEVGISATSCEVVGGNLHISCAEAGLTASTVLIRGGSVFAATSGAGAAIGSASGAGVSTIGIRGGSVSAIAEGTGAAIGSGAGAACCQISITGGKVEATAKSGAAIGGGNAVAGGSITIEGGTIHASTKGGGAALGGGRNGAAGTVTILGGSVFCSVQGANAGNPAGGGFGQAAAAPQNAAGQPLYATYVAGIARDLSVTALVTKLETAYLTKDVYPTAEGYICVWLPASDVVLSVNNAEKTHIGNVPSGTTGKCVAAAVTLPNAGEILIDGFGYQINGGTPIEHAGDYLLSGTGAVAITLHDVTTTITLSDFVQADGSAPVLQLAKNATVTLCIVDENRIAMRDLNCITVESGSKIILKNGNKRGTLTLLGGAGKAAIAGAGTVLQESGSVTYIGGAGACATAVDGYTITGGALALVDGEGATVTDRNLTIGGGMVSMPAGTAVGVQDSSGTSLLPIWVRELPANAPLTACSLTAYGLADMYTNGEGALCLWAPADVTLTWVTIQDTIYKCSLAAGGDGVARKYYAISFYEDADGNRVVADVTEAYEGQTVTITVIPGDNRKFVGVPSVVLDGVSYPTVQQGDGYTFVMPLGAVSLTCQFQPIVITIPAGESQTLTELSIDADQKLVVLGTLIVEDTLENIGVIEVAREGKLEIRGVLTNHGIVQNAGVLLLTADATLENAGTVTTDGRFENNGKLIAHFGSSFQNDGDYVGDGVITGEGKITGVGLPGWAILLILLGSVLLVVAIAWVAWQKRSTSTPIKQKSQNTEEK